MSRYFFVPVYVSIFSVWFLALSKYSNAWKPFLLYNFLCSASTRISEKVLNLEDSCRILQTLADSCRILLDPAESWPILPNRDECLIIIQNVADSYRILQNVEELVTQSWRMRKFYCKFYVIAWVLNSLKLTVHLKIWLMIECNPVSIKLTEIDDFH